jgi:hypothetical protein
LGQFKHLFSHHLLELRPHKPPDLVCKKPRRDNRRYESDWMRVERDGEREEGVRASIDGGSDRKKEAREFLLLSYRLRPISTSARTGTLPRPSGPSPGRRGGAWRGKRRRRRRRRKERKSSKQRARDVRERGRECFLIFFLLLRPSSRSKKVDLFFLHRLASAAHTNRFSPFFFFFSSTRSSLRHGCQRKWREQPRACLLASPVRAFGGGASVRDAGEQREREEETFDACRFFFSLFDRAIVALKRRPFSLVFVAPPLAAEPCLLPR